MKIVITGGIGSGKSTIAKFVRDNLLPSFDFISVDDIVANIYSLEDIRDKLISTFNTCDKKTISKLVFNDSILLNKLYNILNPTIFHQLQSFISLSNNIIIEFPLYFQFGDSFKDDIDYVLHVKCNNTARKQRVISRDNITEDMFNKIDACQWYKTETTDNIIPIYNDDINTAYNHVILAINAIKKKIKYNKKGIVSGSFDPITHGHLHIIKTAITIVDQVYVVVGRNYEKKHYFDIWERINLVRQSIDEHFTAIEKEKIVFDILEENELLVTFAKTNDIGFIFRGLRDFIDLGYETKLNLVQKKIAPTIETVYLFTPRDKIEISSSMIKSNLSLHEWELVVKDYIPTCVFNALKDKRNHGK